MSYPGSEGARMKLEPGEYTRQTKADPLGRGRMVSTNVNDMTGLEDQLLMYCTGLAHLAIDVSIGSPARQTVLNLIHSVPSDRHIIRIDRTSKGLIYMVTEPFLSKLMAASGRTVAINVDPVDPDKCATRLFLSEWALKAMGLNPNPAPEFDADGKMIDPWAINLRREAKEQVMRRVAEDPAYFYTHVLAKQPPMKTLLLPELMERSRKRTIAHLGITEEEYAEALAQGQPGLDRLADQWANGLTIRRDKVRTSIPDGTYRISLDSPLMEVYGGTIEDELLPISEEHRARLIAQAGLTEEELEGAGGEYGIRRLIMQRLMAKRGAGA